MVKFITPAMSSSSDYDQGSVEWIDHRSQILLERFKSIQDNGIRPFLRSLDDLLKVRPEPWKLWQPPPDGPAGTIGRFSRVLLGLDWAALCNLIESYDKEAAQRFRALNAETEADREFGIKRGGDHGNQHTGGKGDVVNLATKGNSAAYLLRRLAREQPDLLEAYECGEFKSARAAAKAAGFVLPRATIPSDMPIADLAAQLRRRFKEPEQRRLLAQLIAGDDQ